jgi:hypothetical protein
MVYLVCFICHMLCELIDTERLNILADKQARCRKDTSHEIPVDKKFRTNFSWSRTSLVELIGRQVGTKYAKITKQVTVVK